MFQADTSILMHYVRGNSLALKIEARYSLLSSAQRPILSVVSQAELLALGRELSWGTQRLDTLDQLLNGFDIIPIPFANIIDSYVEISEFSRRHGRAMGKNDLWIAATARTTGATLLTTDRDFDHLDPALISRRWIDPRAT